jgi:hypothetical protein
MCISEECLSQQEMNEMLLSLLSLSVVEVVFEEVDR